MLGGLDVAGLNAPEQMRYVFLMLHGSLNLLYMHLLVLECANRVAGVP